MKRHFRCAEDTPIALGKLFCENVAVLNAAMVVAQNLEKGQEECGGLSHNVSSSPYSTAKILTHREECLLAAKEGFFFKAKNFY